MIRSIFFVSMLTTALLALINETNEGRFLQIFAEHNAQSKIIAEVSTQQGKIERLSCRSIRDSSLWCEVRYRNKDVILTGWSDKKSLDAANEQPHTRATFEKRYGGRYADVGRALLPLRDGLLIVGYTQSFGKGQNDAYVLKVDRYGNTIWSGTYGGRYDDVAEAVVPVKNGFMLAGSTSSLGNMRQSLYAARISHKGKLMWENGYYSDKDDRYTGKSIAKVNDKFMLIAGSEDHVKFFNSEVACYLGAVSVNGEHTWVQRYGGKDLDKANSIIKVKGGHVFAGTTETWGHGNSDAYVVKIDASGQRVWHNAFGYNDDESANQIIATKDGGYILVGTTNSDRRKSNDIFLVKLNAKGDKEWQRYYGSEKKEEGFGIVEDRDGYVVVGYTENTRNFDSDVYLFKIDKLGNLFWKKTYGGSDDDEGYAIAKVDDGFFITGFSEGASDRGKDLYLLKVNKDGEIN